MLPEAVARGSQTDTNGMGKTSARITFLGNDERLGVHHGQPIVTGTLSAGAAHIWSKTHNPIPAASPVFDTLAQFLRRATEI